MVVEYNFDDFNKYYIYFERLVSGGINFVVVLSFNDMYNVVVVIFNGYDGIILCIEFNVIVRVIDEVINLNVGWVMLMVEDLNLLVFYEVEW